MRFRTFFLVFFSVAILLFAGGILAQDLSGVSSGSADKGEDMRSAQLLHSAFPDVSNSSPQIEVSALQGVGNPPKMNVSYLTGNPRENNDSEIVLGVMIDEAIGARPHFLGVESADVIFEVPAEGGIPRLLTLFSSDHFPESIGPVRSARPYFVELAELAASAYVHAGGSPEALEMVSTSPMVNIDEDEGDVLFFRDENIPRPHNLFVFPKEVLQKISASRLRSPFFLFSPNIPPADESATKIRVDFPNAPHSVSWQYSSEKGCYQRIQSFETADICPENLIVLDTEIWMIEGDAKNRLHVETTGSGSAHVFRNGEVVSGTWKREEGGMFSFFDSNEQEIPLTAGKTFVQILGQSEKLSFSS